VAVVKSTAAEAGCTETPGLPLLGASFTLAALDAGAGMAASEFGVRFGVRDWALLLALLLAVLLVRLPAIANPVSGAPAVGAADVVVGDGAAGAGWAETPILPLLGPAVAIAAIGAGTLEFGVSFGVRDGTLLLATLFAKLLATLLAMANPVSGALSVGAADVVVGDGAAGAGWAETPILPLLGAAVAVAAIGAGTLKFVVSFGVRDGTSLAATLFAKLPATVLAMANPVSGALSVGAAMVVVCDGAAGAGWAESPILPLLGAIVVTTTGAVALAFGVKFGVRNWALLLGLSLGTLGAVLLVRLSAIGDPVSAALAVGAAAVVASDEGASAKAVSSLAEPDVGDGSAALGLPGVDLAGAELLAFESLDSGAAGCFASSGSVIDGELWSLTEACGVGIGVCVGAKEVGGEMLKTGLVGKAGIELLADEAAGWSKELLESDDGAASVSDVAGVGGAEVKGATGTDGDWTVGDWSSAKTVVLLGIGVWNWLSAGAGAGAFAVVGETGVGKTGVGETGVGETEPGGVENGAGAAKSWVGTLGNECAASEAA
jgi:hypothetical protein